MIHWLQHTNVSITDREFIKCKYKNASTTIYDMDLAELSRECAKEHNSLIISIVAPLGVLSVTIMTMMLVYQFRWHLRWHVYKIRRYVRHVLQNNQNDILLDQMDGTYHAFVAHNHDEDYEWVIHDLMPMVEDEWGLRLCIGQRDFIPGKPIVENIADAIDDSRKTILVITPAFAASEWCEFEMQMAIVKGRKDIVMIYKTEVPLENTSKTLRALLKCINYIEYSNVPAGLRVFWERLKSSLNKGGTD